MDLQQLSSKPTTDTAEANGNNANAVATLVGKAGYRWCITGYTMSSDGNVAVKVTPDVVSGALVVDRFKAPATLPVDRVVEFNRPIMCPLGADVVATLPACGAGIIGEVVLRGFFLLER